MQNSKIKKIAFFNFKNPSQMVVKNLVLKNDVPKSEWSGRHEPWVGGVQKWRNRWYTYWMADMVCKTAGPIEMLFGWCVVIPDMIDSPTFTMGMWWIKRAQPWVVQKRLNRWDARQTRVMSFQTRCRYSIHPHMLYRHEWRRHAQKRPNWC